ncbi:GDSL-type esterase/lipase family protein [Lentilactobacillus sp. Marseille-Q4993]|uniref:GDSL-type esterase/lipase family protein n=1 Tax=Lentilactobacillus sp. Marseille-Q4993 TaxID=3039492 RepID=UPI0024BC993B|nr:GDSL-type esterase/lipase family protein [Lentilactobacillus sp. Marseille-Q4993]
MLGVSVVSLLVFALSVVLVKHKANNPKRIDITAVGDSLTQGVGDPDDRGGYVYQINHKIKVNNPKLRVSSSNFGIAGETTNQINHRVETNSKLRANLKQANVITVTTGGNDVIHFLKNNLFTSSQTKLNDKASAFENKYQQRITRLLTNIKKLNPDAEIFVFGIYNPVYVYLPQVKFISRMISDTNETSKSVINKMDHAHYVNISDKLSDGQYQSKKDHQKLADRASELPSMSKQLDETAINQILAGSGDKNSLLSNSDHFHPNKKGYQIMTDRLYQQMKLYVPNLKE